MKLRGLSQFLFLALLLAAVPCLAQERQMPETSGRVAGVALPAAKSLGFADPPTVHASGVTPSLAERGTPVSKARNYQDVMNFLGLTLSPDQEAFLAENRFLLVDADSTTLPELASYDYFSYDEMLGYLDAVGGDTMDPSMRAPENSRLITPDAALHAFHRFFENSLEYLESYDLGQTLRTYLREAQSRVFTFMEASAQNRPLYERYQELAAQITVARILVENGVWYDEVPYETVPEPPDMGTLEHAMGLFSEFSARFSPEMNERIKAELQLIYGASELVPSPLFGQYSDTQRCDYTQYTPRSHYTKSSALSAYFRAMMYLGRNSYFLNDPEGVTDAMLMATIMAGEMSDGRPLLAVWQRIMDLTGFYAGQSDDIGYPEWRDFLVRVLGSEVLTPDMALDPAVVATVTEHLGELQPPRILSDIIVRGDIAEVGEDELLEQTKAFRVFGQRFTFDAWVLGRLTAGSEDSPVPLPSTPTAAFVPAAMGDETARNVSAQFLMQVAGFSQADVDLVMGRMDEIEQDLARVTPEEWYASLGAAWVKLLGTLTTPFGQGYPLYMQNEQFRLKQIQTFLGSYTELKHDTLLYAKQNYAEMGGPDFENLPPVPQGFVEPNMAFWYELQALVEYAMAGFERQGVFEQERDEWGTLGRFQRDVQFYIDIAEKELANEPITEDEYEWLRILSINYMAMPLDPGAVMDDDQRRVALIADIHTDALQGQILYEATGKPYVMLAFVENEGAPRLTVGVAYNHYEFTAPLGGNRLTDEDWRAEVYNPQGTLPEKNFWYLPITVQ